MRLLFALPYGPGVTRVRSRMLLLELAGRHDITLVALVWNDDDRCALEEFANRGLTVHAIPHGMRQRLRSLLALPEHPLQYAVSRSPAFARTVRELIHAAGTSGYPFDAVHVEHLRGAAAIDLFNSLGIRTVFDAVDCLAELARLTRLYSPRPVVRVVARYEQPRTQQMETRLLHAADSVTVVAERDRAALLGPDSRAQVLVIPNGVHTRPQRASLTEQPVAVFTGKLSYHANQAAARWLLTDIWPRVRHLVPEAALTLAGADPPDWLLRYDGRAGVQVIANPPDMQPVLGAARVALAPVVYSVGIQNKVLEPMALGIPVVGTPSAAAGLLAGADTALALAEDAEAFAGETARILLDPRMAERLGAAGHAYVSTHHTWSAVAGQFEALYTGVLEEAKAA